MLTVVTPAASMALTTVQRASALADFGGLSEEAIALSIDHASAAVSDFCRRVFPQQTYRETWARDDYRGGEAMLRRGPVTEITSVTVSGVQLSEADYQADGQWLQLSNGCGAWRGPIVITYKAGFVLAPDDARTLPLAVERAVALEAAAYGAAAARDEFLKSETVEGVGTFSYRVAGADDRLASQVAAQLLRPYVAPMMG